MTGSLQNHAVSEAPVPIPSRSRTDLGWESEFVSRHALLALAGLLRSIFVVRPVSGRREYYRALLLAVVQSLLDRRASHPSDFLRQDVWIRHDGLEYLLTRETVFGYYLHTFEPETARLLRSLTGATFLDIGANTGQYAVPMARQFREVIAVEPNPVATRVLVRNLERNHITNVTVLPVAVGARKGPVTLRRGQYLTTWGIDADHEGEITVDCLTLDALLANRPRVDLLKIDTEGSEASVLTTSDLLGRVDRISCSPPTPARSEVEFPSLWRKLDNEGFRLSKVPPRLNSVENLFAVRRSP